jgi:hypothetical protein
VRVGKRRRGVYGGYPVRCRFIGLGDLTRRSCFFFFERGVRGLSFVPHRCAASVDRVAVIGSCIYRCCILSL